jgi:DNA helicase II / ATP-dependent DNA helicase PcrA
LQTYDNDEAEAREIVAQIEFKRLAHRAPWKDCAILFRTNQQSRPLETELRTAGVRYHLIGGQSFFDRREVKDFLAYLKMFLNPHDDISLLRIANVPARGLSDVTMERLLGASHERKCSVFAAMKNPLVTTTFQANTRKSIEAFVEFVERTRATRMGGACLRPRFKQLRQSGDGALLQSWATISERDRLLRRIEAPLEKDPENGDGRVRNLRELMATMDGSSRQSPPGRAAGKFLENITLDRPRGGKGKHRRRRDAHHDALSCKGLEFPHVFIVGLEDGLLPHSRSKAEGTLDEERRLFYVAVTRAMQTLTISHCGGRKKYGQLLPCHPSPFLKELPEELVEHADSKSKTPVDTHLIRRNQRGNFVVIEV